MYLLRYVIILLVIFIVVFINKELLFDTVLFAPKDPGFPTNQLMCDISKQLDTPALCINSMSFKLINYELSGQFSLHLMVSFIVALLLTFPYLIWEITRFIRKVLEKIPP